MKIYQSTSVDNPNAPNEIANKEYVDGKLGDAANSFAAPVFITDITSAGSGIIGDKQYLDGTIPANTIVSQATSDDDSITISVMAEGGRFYSPILTVHGEPELPNHEGVSIPLIQDQYDIRTFHGQITINGINTDTIVCVRSNTGADAVVDIRRAANGPSVEQFTIGGYPNGQQAAREDQTVIINGIVDNNAVSIDVLNYGAAKADDNVPTTFGTPNSAAPGYKTFQSTFVVSDNSGYHSVRINARNEFGTPGTPTQSSNDILLDQAVPSIQNIVISYPNGQQAIKDLEEATITFDLINVTESEYFIGSGITEVSGRYSGSEELVVSGVGAGNVESGYNLSIIARHTENGTEATADILIKVTNDVHTNTVSIVGSPVRLMSSPSGEEYTVLISSSKKLDDNFTPTLSAPSGSLSGLQKIDDFTWTATLIVTDTNQRGVFDFSNIVTVGESGLVASGASNTQYTIGGFTERTLTIPLYDDTPGDEVVGRTVDLGVTVGDINKVIATLSGVSLNLVTNTDDAPLSFTIVDNHQGFTDPYVQIAQYDPTGYILYVNDRDQSGANTTGTMTITVREVA